MCDVIYDTPTVEMINSRLMFIDVAVMFWNHRCGSGCFFFFQAEDGIRDLVRSRGSEMCIRDRHRN